MNTRLKLLIITAFGSFTIIFNIFMFFYYFSIERKPTNKKIFEENGIDIDLSLFKKAIEFSESKTPFSFENNNTEQASVQPDSDKITTPTVTSKTVQFTVQIFNASGISGIASGLKEELEKNQQILVTQIGNTDNSQNTIVKSKSSVSESMKTLIYQTVEKNFLINQKETLPDSNTSDIIIILGQQKLR
ncbi:LytR C-terminal domain-containing protein [Patescibacteria group bacterium]|nr:LytR C-terminal domain-containing protein [Patescibacteria group bacterium]